MKTITPAMQAHIKGDTTTLTTCWKITRTDGKAFFYTELDHDITHQGHNYRSAAGFNKTAMKSSASFAVNEMEVTGFLRDDEISDEEMGNGAFDFALVEVFLINYEDQSMGTIKLRYGYFGEVKKTGSGAFQVELRGLVDLLSQKIGNTYLPECRLDLGERKCGINLTPPVHGKGRRYKKGDRVIFPVSSTQIVPDRYYSHLLDPDLGPWLQTQGADPLMTPRSGTKVAFTAIDGMTVGMKIADLGLTREDVQSGAYKAKISGYYFIYWQNTSGYFKVTTQTQNGGGSYTDIESITSPAPNVKPERRWHRVEAELNISPGTDRIVLSIGCDGGNFRPKLCWDDFEIVITKRDDEAAPGYEQYGGVEFEATNTGMASTSNVTFDPSVGALTSDGTIVWKAVLPVHTFLGTVSALSPFTNTVNSAPIAVSEGWFDWGVIKFLTGRNAGRAVEVMSYDRATGQIKTALPLPYQPQLGDEFSIQTGCDKRRETCIAKFANILNFRGHPRVPGQGAYFKVAGL